ncbi:M3 family metallopeptidase [Enterovirga aerilata]|uniref:M3 family metallopeptidase n=1 Tax=Enterovirga aerilata TaxID=2730920 RepID=A0A849HU75_9HYPH|nr:M3 family metallopeptidase [Enterovirga sp. DB1703]
MTGHRPDNVLIGPWATPFGAPPFDLIDRASFRDAFDHAIAEDRREVDLITNDPAEPSFENTIVALERSGRLLNRVSATFFNLTGADTDDTLKAIERDIAPVLAKHNSSIYLNDALFRRIDLLKGRRDELGLGEEEVRLLDKWHKLFVRQGAGRPAEVRARLAEIGERLAVLGTRFGQNVLADEQAYTLRLETEEDLAGLPDFMVAAAREAAAERGLDGHVITLSRSSIEPFLQYCARRDLREKAFRAWIARGEGGGETDNRAIIAEMVELRAERARLLGYASFAHFRLDDTMAGTPERALELLRSVWGPARALALREAADLQKLADAEGGGFRIAPWDWRYYAERLRKERFALDAEGVKPYLQLDRVIEAAFDCAGRLFGLNFTERRDVPTYHPDVRAFEVTDREGRHVGLFLGDYFARPSKRSGAWMSAFRTQWKLDGEVRPIIVNVMNFSKSAGEEPALLSFDDARTLFHEFGHGLHGLLSDVTYPSLAGTAVPRDFVEFPSQLYEHWLEQPAVLRRYARHYRTGEPMPDSLIERVLASRQFNQGFATVEYTASALVDMELHLLPSAHNLDVVAFERATLESLGMPEPIAMRHRTPHFGHVFSGEGYSAAYYSYLWSETLDADGFAAFEEAGDIFDPATAGRLRRYVYSAGDLRDPAEAYRAFRGRLPSPEALMRQRGLLAVASEAEM